MFNSIPTNHACIPFQDGKESCVRVTIVSLERIFSTAGNVVTDHSPCHCIDQFVADYKI